MRPALLLALAALMVPRPALAPSRDQTLALAGLSAPARVVTDRWGIPHIAARNLPDLYFAWGFVSARDRLWQLEHTRRAARGRLWEWVGNSSLRADAGAQLFELDERAGRIWARERARPEVRVPVERYAAGINAWIERCRLGLEPWPEELQRLRRQPAVWRPQDTVLLLLAQGALLDLDFPELEEARQIREHGRDWLDARRRFESDYIFDTIPDSAARRLYGGGAAAASRHARPRAAVEPGAAQPLPPRLLAAAAERVAGWLGGAARDADARASNVFAVGPGRSASRAPLLANDPHLELGSPGPLWIVHVSVPDTVEAIGACVPGLPAIVSGRNRSCAWGVTSLSEDVVDVYADTLSRDGRSVRWNGGWAPIREASYDLRFRWLGIPLPPFGQVRRYTPHGPVLAMDRTSGIALSARWAGATDFVTLGALLGLERARSAPEVCARMRDLATPGLNVGAADREGRVLYQCVGLTPRRLFPPTRGVLPGDGRHEWAGFVPRDSMPAWAPPRDGFFVNANNRPVGPAWPVSQDRYDWVHDRAARIAQRLAGDRSITLADLESVQNDVHSRSAERLLPRLLRRAESLPESLGARERAALVTLGSWNLEARRSQVAPALFRGWYGAFLRRSRLEGVPGLAVAALDGRAAEALRSPGGAAESPEVAAVASLKMALDTLASRLGPDLSRWTYGRAHRARFVHPLAGIVPGVAWEPDPMPADGDNGTPCVGPSRLPWNTLFTHASVFRHLVDLAVVDSSLGVVPPGNSGDRRGTHTRDLARRWAAHDHVPLYLSWPRIERAAESELTLRPRD